ncbi:hypothetical protein TCAL_10599 [Tigriopus californicus]|uniref:Small ribosomal subunit protein uS14 n=1 Tax=Tigriopus californicus TaxID=6832 RepID=A0A553P3A0_TIGCA|nr:hypothetical protein TCAL_10599 [Tigriopus californicus]
MDKKPDWNVFLNMIPEPREYYDEFRVENRRPFRVLTMGFENIHYSRPRKFGQGSRQCRACSNGHGMIRKYGLNMCRQCFREYAKDIGFKKLD